MVSSEIFSSLGVNALIGYGKYKSVKEDGDFVDFLLHYDEEKTKNNDFSWLNGINNNENELMFFTSILPIENKEQTSFDLIKSQSYSSVFDMQVSGLKYQLFSAFKERIDNSNLNEFAKKQEVTKLYEQMQNVKIPERFKS